MKITIRERYLGLLLGLVIGDAMGVPLEFRKPGTFTPIREMIGGGTLPNLHLDQDEVFNSSNK